MQDNIPDALSAAFERHYDFPWSEPKLRNERLAWRAAWASAMEQANTEVQAAWIAGQDEVRSQRPAPCLHQIQEPTVSQQLTVAQKPLSDAQIDAVGDRLAREHAVYLTRNSVRALLAGVSAPAAPEEQPLTDDDAADLILETMAVHCQMDAWHQAIEVHRVLLSRYAEAAPQAQKQGSE